jgi:hypothetical protein
VFRTTFWSSQASEPSRRAGWCRRPGSELPPDSALIARGSVLLLAADQMRGDPVSSGREIRAAVHACHLVSDPASTGSVIPVTYRDSSEASHSTALEMSAGSTHGIGSAFSARAAPAMSSAVGFSRSGRNSR